MKFFLIYKHLKRGADMKIIRVVKENNIPNIFEINGYSFVEVDSEMPSLPIYRVIIKYHFASQLDVRYWIEEAISGIDFLSDMPSELTEYIKKYEENIRFKETCLFHDLRTKYIDFLLYNGGGRENNVLLGGYTLLEDETCFAFKAFSLSVLAVFVQELTKYCNIHQISMEVESNLRWIQLQQRLLPDTNIIRNDVFNSFLNKTLQIGYSDIFIRAFRNIDLQGYLDRGFYSNEVSINGNITTIGKVSQFTKYFTRFWKTEISVKNVSRIVLCLHDELMNDETIDKMVYTIKPHLMQYYQLHWFEDFCGEIIKNINSSEFKIVDSYSGRKFNFFQNSNGNDVREIDIVLNVLCRGMYKIIAIECKKTLTNDEIKGTNKKIRDKVLKSHNNIIDAYIHIGCFNNGVEFDKKIEGTHEKYKRGKIQLKNEDVYDAPYFAFSISSIENLKLKMCYVIKEIFDQW